MLFDEILDLFCKQRLVIAVECACNLDALEHLFRIHVKGFCDLHNTFWSEGSFSVDVHRYAVSTALVFWQLTAYSKDMTQRCFAGAVSAEAFCHGACLEPAAEEFIDFFASGRDLDHAFTFAHKLIAAFKVHFKVCAGNGNDFFRGCFADLCCSHDFSGRGDCDSEKIVISCGLEFLQCCWAYAGQVCG